MRHELGRALPLIQNDRARPNSYLAHQVGVSGRSNSDHPRPVRPAT